MQMYEIKPLIQNSYLRTKENWEQARLIAYTIAQVNSSKKIKPTDILSFSWDKDTPADTAVSNEDIKRIRRKAELVSKLL